MAMMALVLVLMGATPITVVKILDHVQSESTCRNTTLHALAKMVGRHEHARHQTCGISGVPIRKTAKLNLFTRTLLTRGLQLPHDGTAVP